MRLEGVISFTKHWQDLLCVRLITCKYLVEVKQIYSLKMDGPGGGNQLSEKRLCFFSQHQQQSCLFSESGRDPVGFSFMRFNVKVLYFMR